AGLIAATGSEFVLNWGEAAAKSLMKLEVRMSTFSNEIQDQVKAGRQTVEKSLGEIKQIDVRQMPPIAFLAAGLAAAAAAAGVATRACPFELPRSLRAAL